MKLLCVFLIVCAANAVPFVSSTTDSEDPVPKDNKEVLWQALYDKLNTLLSVTEVLSQSISDLQQRQDDQEDRVLNLMQNLTTDAKKYMDDKAKELHQRLDYQDDLIRQAFNNSQQWTSILRRQDGSVDFYRNWEEYRKGFGSPDGEFFIGLDKLHIMTTYGAPQELLVVLIDWQGETRYAKYDLFQIASEEEQYAIKELGLYSGNAGDALSYHKLAKFSTLDNDNDHLVNSSCAVSYAGAGWYKACFRSHLNGPYRPVNNSNNFGVSWLEWKEAYSFKFAEMLIRSKL